MIGWDRFVDLVTVVWLAVFVAGLVYPEYLQITNVINIGLLFIFVLDLFVEYRRVGSLRTFIRKKWFDILLVVPYLRIFRVIRAIRVLRIARTIKTARTLKIAKASKASTIMDIPHKVLGWLKAYKKIRRLVERFLRKCAR